MPVLGGHRADTEESGVMQGADGIDALGHAVMYMTLESNLRLEDELAFIEVVEGAAAARGIRLNLRLGCILAQVLDPGQCTPEEIMRIMVDAMGGSCTQAMLQVGLERLLTWQPGADS